MGLGFHYCKECQEEIERMDLGYPATNFKCTKLKCKLIDIFQIIIMILIAIILSPILILILLLVLIFNFIVSD